MPKKKKTFCKFDSCNGRYVPLIGDCSYCELKYCEIHRLPEDHHCDKINDCKKESFNQNKAKLLSEKTVSKKINSI